MDQPPVKSKVSGSDGLFSVMWVLWLNNMWKEMPIVGTGNPNSNVTASPGATYVNKAGGANTTFWVKESGVETSTGWVGK